ncbi:unnamed protein product [Orchesella dallaii]|uniref:Uncharacterized protein n=1 Tax=Orchesella dallaii TaxID=48710 RepID=A0ABP1RUT1_9HEXA
MTSMSPTPPGKSYHRQKTIGNGHLKPAKLLQLLIEGCLDINKITEVAANFSNNPTLLRKQLESLTGTVDDACMQSYIKQVSDAIPVRFASTNKPQSPKH